MLKLIRTSNDNPDFQKLINALDAELFERYGEIQSAYTQFNVLDLLHTAVIVYNGDVPAGCACFKEFTKDTVEIKRMFVSPAHRGLGVASMILKELEKWAKELSYTTAVLETGDRLNEAISMYNKAGFQQTEKYGQYVNMPESICFKKIL